MCAIASLLSGRCCLTGLDCGLPPLLAGTESPKCLCRWQPAPWQVSRGVCQATGRVHPTPAPPARQMIPIPAPNAGTSKFTALTYNLLADLYTSVGSRAQLWQCMADCQRAKHQAPPHPEHCAAGIWNSRLLPAGVRCVGSLPTAVGPTSSQLAFKRARPGPEFDLCTCTVCLNPSAAGLT